jgi:large subunit ribosomal protein L18
MARAKVFRIPHRRKREGKTDYRQRLRLLQSKKPRFVVRRSLNNLTCQIIQYVSTGDKTIVSVNSKHLKKIGWNGHSGNIPASYLIGLLCGIKAKKRKIKHAVMDIGMFTSTKGSRIYAALKGALDAGLDIPHSDKILPSKERVTGEHIAKLAEILKKENPSAYKNRFSQYLKNKIKPEEIPKHFEEIKKRILKTTSFQVP